MIIEIDREFARLVPPATEEEREQLERNIQQDGLLDPLRVWDQGNGRAILLDGHTRKAICDKHRIPYADRVVKIAVQDRNEARAWIIHHQLGRRNLPPYQRGELALLLKKQIEARARERQAHGQTAPGKTLPMNSSEALGGESPRERETRTQLAKAANVSPQTLGRIEYLAGHADEETKEKLRRGETTINREYNTLRREKEGREPASRPPRVASAPSLLSECAAWIDQAIQRGELPDDLVAEGRTLLNRIGNA